MHKASHAAGVNILQKNDLSCINKGNRRNFDYDLRLDGLDKDSAVTPLDRNGHFTNNFTEMNLFLVIKPFMA